MLEEQNHVMQLCKMRTIGLTSVSLCQKVLEQVGIYNLVNEK